MSRKKISKQLTQHVGYNPLLTNEYNKAVLKEKYCLFIHISPKKEKNVHVVLYLLLKHINTRSATSLLPPMVLMIQEVTG